MTEQGFKGFQRGEYGSTAEHLTSLQYQIKQDKERLEKLQQRICRHEVQEDFFSAGLLSLEKLKKSS